MQMKISKTLESVLARAAFDTAKAGITHSLKDRLAVELLREEGSLAFQLLSSRLKDWEVYQIRLRIEHEIAAAQPAEELDPETFFRAFREELCEKSGAVRSISTIHALRLIAADTQTITARVLEMYGVTAEIIAADLQKFAVADDFRSGIQVQMLDFSADSRPEPKDEPHLLD